MYKNDFFKKVFLKLILAIVMTFNFACGTDASANAGATTEAADQYSESDLAEKAAKDYLQVYMMLHYDVYPVIDHISIEKTDDKTYMAYGKYHCKDKYGDTYYAKFDIQVDWNDEKQVWEYNPFGKTEIGQPKK